MVYVQAEVSAATGSPVAELKPGSFGAFCFACLPRSDSYDACEGPSRLSKVNSCSQQLWQPTRNGVLSTLRFVLQQDSFHQTKHDRPTMRLCCTLTVALTVACCLSCCSCLEHVKTRCIVGCHSRFLKTMSGCYSIVISTPRQDVPCYHQNLL